VCCSDQLARYLTNTARTLIFSTGPAPPSVAAALAAIELLAEQPRQIERLHQNARTLRAALADEGFRIEPGETQIAPLIVGDSHLTMDFCERALERGVFAQAVRPPTVPHGSSRLRLAAMATHTAAELRWAARELAAAADEAGLEPVGTEPVFDHSETHDEHPVREAA
jgi:glycine C-acetyltransferase/8-amino-7-oxononanoate synthase